VLQGQAEQLSDVTTRLHKALTKLELCQSQLEKKQREVKELQEAAKARPAAGWKQQAWQALRSYTCPPACFYCMPSSAGINGWFAHGTGVQHVHTAAFAVFNCAFLSTIAALAAGV
jgi:hypothetical protein